MIAIKNENEKNEKNENEENLKKPFGSEWKKYFSLGPINLNHGSYGSVPISILNKKHKLAENIEIDPDYFIRYKAEPEIREVINDIAEIVSAENSDIMIVSSASDGVNAFYKSISWSKGDKIFFYNTVYGMTRQLFNHLQEKFQVHLVECILTRETIEDEAKLINFTKEFVEKNGPFKAANLEHIGSIPTFIYPIDSLIKIFQKDGTIILVDGAHAIGNIPINLKNIRADGYLSNLHKWMFAPRGTAFLYASKNFQKILHPNIISHYYKTDLQKEFIIPCTMDYSAWLAAKIAIAWRKQIGEQNIQQFTNKMAWEAGLVVSKIWGTTLLIRQEERLASMVNVECYGNIKKEDVNQKMREFKEMYGTFLPMFWFDGKSYVRLSGQIYNTIDEFEKVARDFMEFY